MTTPLDSLQDFLDRTPYARFLGVKAELAGDEMTAILPFSPHLIGNPTPAALHGGVIGGFMELTAMVQLAIAQGEGAPAAKPIDIGVEYLLSGRLQTTYARATVNRVGRRIANVHVEAWQDTRAKPIAYLRGHFLVG